MIAIETKLTQTAVTSTLSSKNCHSQTSSHKIDFINGSRQSKEREECEKSHGVAHHIQSILIQQWISSIFSAQGQCQFYTRLAQISAQVAICVVRSHLTERRFWVPLKSKGAQMLVLICSLTQNRKNQNVLIGLSTGNQPLSGIYFFALFVQDSNNCFTLKHYFAYCCCLWVQRSICWHVFCVHD